MIPDFPMAIEPQKNNFSDYKHAIWCITPKGKVLGLMMKKALKDSELHMPKKLFDEFDDGKNIFTFDSLGLEIKKKFNRYSGHIFLFSTGIAVRLIAGLLRSKLVDPAVVVVDDNGKNAISLISGHIGGANALAKKIADIINARPVITTATDTNGLPAIDLIAVEKGLYIETPGNIKRINMAFLKEEPIILYDPLGLIEARLQGIAQVTGAYDDKETEKIFCSHEIKSVSRETMVLRPPVLNVGIGCNRGTGGEEIYNFLTHVFKEANLSIHSIKRFSSIDLKADEKGLLSLSEKMKLPMEFHAAEKLNSVESIHTPSEMVEKHVGVKSVCEAAAILSAGNGNLIVTKKKNKDVTIAVAIRK